MGHIWKTGSAAVVGAAGGVGHALVRALSDDGDFKTVVALTRRPTDALPAGVRTGFVDLTDEASITQAAAEAGHAGDLRLVIVATGMLHGDGMMPEKNLRSLQPDHLARAFAINAIGPAMVAKHFLPRLPRTGETVFAALSARVGSISDNRSGGWYAYRASKAALNMLIRTLSIEFARTHPDGICVGLHPGTVDTRLSQPFQAGIPSGRLFTPEHSARCLLDVLDRLQPEQTGGCFAWDGSPIAP